MVKVCKHCQTPTSSNSQLICRACNKPLRKRKGKSRQGIGTKKCRRCNKPAESNRALKCTQCGLQYVIKKRKASSNKENHGGPKIVDKPLTNLPSLTKEPPSLSDNSVLDAVPESFDLDTLVDIALHRSSSAKSQKDAKVITHDNVYV